MAVRPLLISNNPEYGAQRPKNADLRLVDGGALDVLIAARDLAHKGWRLANHPLYGNFRPHQQPYRSLLLLPPQSSAQARLEAQDVCTPLGLLEEALTLYQGSIRKSLPGDVPEAMREDCAKIDMELMKATLESLS